MRNLGGIHDDRNSIGQELWGIIGDSIGRGRNDEDGDQGPASIYAGTVFEHIDHEGIVDLQNSDLADANDGSQWKKAGMDYYKYTGAKMVFSNGAIGSASFYPRSGFGTNNWSSTGANRALFEAKIANGMGHVGVTKMRGCFMVLGINDASGTEDLALIEAAIDDTFSWFFTTYPGVPLYIWNIGYNTSGADARVLAIRGYIENAVADYPGQAYIVLAMADYADYVGSDQVHLTQFGNDLMGAATIEYMRQNALIDNDPVAYSPAGTAASVIAGFPTALSTDESKIVNDFVEFMISGGVSAWDDLDVCVCSCFNAEANALHDMIGTTNPVNNGATHIPYGGIETSGATSSRINTDFIPSTDGVNFIQNDAQWICLIVKNNHALGTAAVHMGAIGSSTNKRVQFGQNTAGGITWRVNDNNSNSFGAGATLNGGYYRARRTASNSAEFDQNMSGENSAGTAVSILDTEITIGCRNNNGTLDAPGAIIVGAWAFGDSTVAHTSVMRQFRNLVASLMALGI